MIQRLALAAVALATTIASIAAVALPDDSSPDAIAAAPTDSVLSARMVETPSELADGANSAEGKANQSKSRLMVSYDPQRRPAQALAQAELKGHAYIFLHLTGGRAADVSFWLDDDSGSPDQVEKNSPYDLAGGSDDGANPLDTTSLADGKHSVTAKATMGDGSTVVTVAQFQIKNGSVVAPSSSTSVTSDTPTTDAEAPTTTAGESTTTTGAPSPTPDPIDGDVRFEPGDDVESTVAKSPSGTVFVFSSGTYQGLSIQPGANQTFIGEPGAVLDGNGAPFAFRSGNPGVTIQDLEITGYEPDSREAAIEPEGGGKDWTLIDNEIHENGEKGVHFTSGWTVTGNSIHHNGRYGITGSGEGVVLANNEISYNSTDYGATGDSGGTKFVLTYGLVLRGNYVHHNYGNGLWIDINNVDALVEGNTLVGNQMAGVFIEISCGGTIRNNTVSDNGHANPYPNWMAGSSGILVANSPDVQIYGNSVSGNEKGIGATQVDHSNLDAVTNCTPQLRNLSVHDNVVSQTGGAAAGLDANNNQDSVWSSWGNKFEDNEYNLSSGAQFRWEGDWISYDEWKANGLN